jgi:hypothetical protein
MKSVYLDEAMHAILEASRHAHHQKQHSQAKAKLREAIDHAEKHAAFLERHDAAEADTFRKEFEPHIKRIMQLMEKRGTKLTKSQAICGSTIRSRSLEEQGTDDLVKSISAFESFSRSPKDELLHRARVFKQKVRELVKAKIYSFETKKLIAENPTDEQASLIARKHSNLTETERASLEAKDPFSQNLDRVKARFGSAPGDKRIHSFIDAHHKHGHDEPYVGGGVDNCAWRSIEKDKNPKVKNAGRWNDPMPFPVHPDKVNVGGVLGKRVAQGGTDPFMWMDRKYGHTKEVLRRHKDKDLEIHTRSDLIAHDEYMDHLTPGKHKIFMHLSTRNSDLQRNIEPGAASPLRRLEAAKRLRDAGHDVTIVHDRIPGIEHHEPRHDSVNELSIAASHGQFKHAVNEVKLTPEAKKRLHQSIGGGWGDLSGHRFKPNKE